VYVRANPAFNKEVFVDFIAAQIKTLSFLAYIIRIYQENINVHSAQMVKGMLGLLTMCPQEVAHLRKELLIAARHILATDLRNSMSLAIVCCLVPTALVGMVLQSVMSVCLSVCFHSIFWQRGAVVSGVRRMNEVNARRAWLVPGWVTVFGRVYYLGM